LNTNGVVLGSYSAPNDRTSGTFLAPEGVTTDGNGNILIADTGKRRIVTLRGLLPTNPPPRFLIEYTRWTPSGEFQTRVATATGQRLLIKMSSDLSSWTDLTNVTATSSFVDLQDPAAPAAGRRFYRATTQ